MIDAVKIIIDAQHDLDHNRITLGEYEERVKPLNNVIAIPKGATNGDIFLSTHKDVVATVIMKRGNLFDVVQLRHERDTIPFAEVYIDWWNAPYKEG